MICEDFRNKYATYEALPLAPDVWQSQEFSAWSDHLHECQTCADWYLSRRVEERGESLAAFPCVHIAFYSTMTCDIHGDPWECPDMTLVRTESGFGLPVRDGGESVIDIAYCPWCGRKV